jgi:adenylate cyclase
VKGKLQAERIFALMGDANLSDTPAFAEARIANTRMLAAYRMRDWDAADARLDEFEALSPRLGQRLAGYVALCRRRIGTARASPPPADWDGVYDATDK